MEPMRRILSVAAFILLAGFLSAPAAQEMSKKEAVKPAPGPSQAVLEQWNEIGRKLIAMAEDFPEDKYDFKPTPAQRTFAQQLLHVSGANYYFTNAALGQKPPGEGDPKREQYKTRAEVAAFVKKSFADGAAAITAKGDAGMNDLVKDPFSDQQMRIGDFAYGFIEHAGEIYGQLAVYYRVAGMVPPESRPKK
jgi:uncharacterized damage-inducible protein DinB